MSWQPYWSLGERRCPLEPEASELECVTGELGACWVCCSSRGPGRHLASVFWLFLLRGCWSEEGFKSSVLFWVQLIFLPYDFLVVYFYSVWMVPSREKSENRRWTTSTQMGLRYSMHGLPYYLGSLGSVSRGKAFLNECTVSETVHSAAVLPDKRNHWCKRCLLTWLFVSPEKHIHACFSSLGWINKSALWCSQMQISGPRRKTRPGCGELTSRINLDMCATSEGSHLYSWWLESWKVCLLCPKFVGPW